MAASPEYHTSTRQLAGFANEIRPALLLITNRENPDGAGRTPPEEEYLDEIARFYSGRAAVF